MCEAFFYQAISVTCDFLFFPFTSHVLPSYLSNQGNFLLHQERFCFRFLLSTEIQKRIEQIFIFCLSWSGLRGLQFQQRSPNCPLLGQFDQLLQEDAVTFPCQMRNVIFPTCSGSASGSDAQNTSASRHPGGMLNMTLL